MIVLPGYEIQREICRGNRRIYYRGIRKSDRRAVVIKTHYMGQGAAHDQERLRHEYELLKGLGGKGLPLAMALEAYPGGVSLILEDMDGLPLTAILGDGRIDLFSFLSLAERISRSIWELHRLQVIHKDLQPDHIFCSTDGQRVWLVDFRYASVLPKEKPKVIHPRILEGSLSYMSPEQTGRMNRDLDYRTDFYSLGVLFYQLLTGHLPFESPDPLELVHGHLAKQPLEPHLIDSGIPRAVSDIVMKLLAKNAEERYRSGRGLYEDLRKCRHQLERTGTVKDFALGGEDFPERFQVSQKIYGREKEAAELLRIFGRAAEGPVELAVVSGSPGVGKTSLVHEVYKPITARKGFFIEGKFDQFHQNIPYSALVHAFQGLVKQLLTESEADLKRWRLKMLAALGEYGQILIDVIPDVELVIGSQPPVKKLDAVESQNRFNRVMMEFIRVFCDARHPLTIFLDDLQWVDAATLKLIEEMMTGARMQHLFLIVSYRHSEVGSDHSLWQTLANLEKVHCAVSRIAVSPLGLGDTACLLRDTLQSGPHPVDQLAELVLQKTGGNPFFINQFLTMLHEEELIVFHPGRSAWEWDLPRIRALEITENVVALLLRRLERMPLDTRGILMIASCIGSQFDLRTLLTVTEYNADEIMAHLLPAIRENLVVTTSTYGAGERHTADGKDMPAVFRFRHDRIRQAAYALIREDEKKAVHLKTGRLMLANLAPSQYEEGIYDVIHHLNMAADLILKPEERDEAAKLNLIAGKRAKVLAAFETAFSYFGKGIQFLDEASWERCYDLTLQLYVEAVEAARLCGSFNRMEGLFEIVMRRARTVLDRVDVYQSRIHAFISENRRGEALVLAREILKAIGMDLPQEPTATDVLTILEETRSLLTEETVAGLPGMPRMTDPYHLAAMKIMGSVTGAAYQISQDWFVILTCRQVDLSIRHGNFSISAVAYVGMGLIICGYTGDMDLGHRLGRLGLDLLSRFGARELEARAYMMFYSLVHHWKYHLRDTLEFLLAGYNRGLESGDFEFGNYNATIYACHYFFAGHPLEDTELELARFGKAFKRLKQEPTFIYNSILHQIVLNLLERSDAPHMLKGEVYDEEAMLPLHREAGDTTALFAMKCCKILLCYLFEKYPEAVQTAISAEKDAEVTPGFFFLAIYHFLDSLSRLAVHDRQPEEAKPEILKRVRENQAKMKLWMTHAPMNHAHRFYLVEAELARIQGRDAEAIRFYDLAIRHARENGYRNEEALANELGAKFWLDREHPEFAGTLMQRAYACYALWGASAKMEDLIEKYRPLLTNAWLESMPAPNHPSGAPRRQVEFSQEKLDLDTLMKSSQAISGEIELDRLLGTMMKIVIENAGAERGVLLLAEGENLRAVAQGTAGREDIVVEPVDTPVEAAELPSAVIHYVARTREVLVISDAAKEGRFRSDVYIDKYRPRSILGIPVIHKTKITGIIYLENRLMSNVFSPDRLEVLALLTSQIAISIENTLLFERVKKAEEKYRGIFENAVEGIFLSSPDGMFISANPAMAHILGYDSPEELCRRIKDLDHQVYEAPEYRHAFLELLFKNHSVSDFEAPFLRKDGTRIWVSLNARSIFNAQGDLDMIEGFIVDITERKAATDALRRREEDLRKENILLRSNIKDRYRFGCIIGKSASMQEVYELILRAAGTDAPVIIYGESGSGKELVARAIHDNSERRQGDFIPVNCGAIPVSLLESEFFGYKKGAFTGAHMNKKGYLDMAQDGTLFMDELGEIDLNFQVKLLRALEDGSFTPLGDQKVRYSNARVVAATSRDLQVAIRQGLMREDFFYRIHIIPIYLPPLRERQEDIPLLIEHFLKIHSQKEEIPPINGKMIEALLSHSWPGNVRELQNVLHRYCTLGKIDFLSSPAAASPFPEQGRLRQAPPASGKACQSIIQDTEKELIEKALRSYNGNRKQAALALGIPLRSFYRKLKRYQLG